MAYLRYIWLDLRIPCRWKMNSFVVHTFDFMTHWLEVDEMRKKLKEREESEKKLHSSEFLYCLDSRGNMLEQGKNFLNAVFINPEIYIVIQ